MSVHNLSRLLIGAALVFACVAVANAGRATAGSTPAVPMISYHHHFDHHWYVWLPRHPTYEAVEVMTIDAPYNPYRLVWVFFTERDGEKRQHHFMDDPRIAEGTDYFHYRKIEYRRTGESGAGQSVRVSLTGLDGVPFEVEIDAEGVALTTEGAGLTDQSGHGADRVVMLFHRKRSARAESNRVSIGGEDYSFRAEDDPKGMHRFLAAYSAGIQIVVFPFGQWTFEGDETRLSSEAAGFSFTAEGREDGSVLVSDLLGYQNRTAIELDADGSLQRYRHDVGEHRMVISLNDALPLTGPAPQSASHFTVLLDPDEPVASGRVVSAPTDSGRRLSWTIDTPSWAAGYPFETLVEKRAGGVTLTIRSARASD